MRRIVQLAPPIALFLLFAAIPAVSGSDNPPAPGFDLEGSSPEAITVADRTMEAMGGRSAWDSTRFLRWRFFGRRLHVWDKSTGDLRVEATDEEERQILVLMNLGTKTGQVWRDGVEITAPGEKAEMLHNAESQWINDSYWVFMPYKLKDTGVTLDYLGERLMEDGRQADVVELVFENIGRTPENKYRVYVAEDSGLVEQWDFYGDAADEEPRFTTPWHNWQTYGAILLSDDRGKGGHTDLAVYEELPATVFTDPAPVDWAALDR